MKTNGFCPLCFSRVLKSQDGISPIRHATDHAWALSSMGRALSSLRWALSVLGWAISGSEWALSGLGLTLLGLGWVIKSENDPVLNFLNQSQSYCESSFLLIERTIKLKKNDLTVLNGKHADNIGV